MRVQLHIGASLLASLACIIAISHWAPQRAAALTSLNHVALGDSVAISNGGQSYPADYSARTSADLRTSVNLSNLGVGGWTSGDLLGALRTNSAFRTFVAGAQMVTWDVGLDDIGPPRLAYKAGTCGGADNQDCLRAALSSFRSNLNAIIIQIRTLNSNPLLMLRAVDVYNPFISADTADGSLPALKPYFSTMNAYIHTTAAAAGVPTAAVYALFNGANGTTDPAARGYLAPDGVHPNVAGSAAIAEALRVLGYEPLAHDSDGDLVVDQWDNCPNVSNPAQTNTRADFIDLHVYGKMVDDTTVLNSTTLGDACNADIDGDGFTNVQEQNLGPGGPDHSLCASATANTDPTKLDSDGDGFTDRAECMLGTNPVSPASRPPAHVGGDRDHDGLADALEATLGTDASTPDSDGDKLNDGVEFLFYGSDATNTNTDGDICTDGKEAVSVNNDTTVNSTDQLIVAQSFSIIGGAKYVPDLDINRDGNINSTDLLIQAKLFGPC